ncbi:MAG: hypothetical protein WEB88_00910 [Gemmatimonadota bacterium]
MLLLLFMMVLLVALLIPLTAVVLDSQVGRAIAARLEGRRGGMGDGLERRMAVLEGEVDRMARELQRLEEENAFVRQLLEEKPPADRALPPGRSDG